MKITIIDYGAGNVQSVLFALERLGYQATVTDDPDKIKKADKVILILSTFLKCQKGKPYKSNAKNLKISSIKSYG